MVSTTLFATDSVIEQHAIHGHRKCSGTHPLNIVSCNSILNYSFSSKHLPFRTEQQWDLVRRTSAHPPRTMANAQAQYRGKHIFAFFKTKVSRVFSSS